MDKKIGVDCMSKAKGKGGTGRGTGKKGWNRWQASANKKRVTSLTRVRVLKIAIIQRKRWMEKLPKNSFCFYIT